ncbi:ribonuclease D [Streptomyces sp. NPDC050804]|uniref:ribonuclease D n=1 Tax=Streptomyces sp. NPDC050804 TaxID=3154745 RepID=UPI003439F32D
MQAQKSTHEARVGDIRVFRRDLPHSVYAKLVKSGRVAWDIETNGLDPQEAQIGTCQIYARGVGAFIVTDVAGNVPPVLARLLSDENVFKVFHHAPFDLSFMVAAWNVEPRNVACTKIAVKLIMPSAPAEKFSLKYLMAHHFDMQLDKQIRFTNWMTDSLSANQVEYAVGDVIRLLDLYDLLASEISRRGLSELYDQCLKFLPTHVELRLHGCPDPFKY